MKTVLQQCQREDAHCSRVLVEELDWRRRFRGHLWAGGTKVQPAYVYCFHQLIAGIHCCLGAVSLTLPALLVQITSLVSSFLSFFIVSWCFDLLTLLASSFQTATSSHPAHQMLVACDLTSLRCSNVLECGELAERKQALIFVVTLWYYTLSFGPHTCTSY